MDERDVQTGKTLSVHSITVSTRIVKGMSQDELDKMFAVTTNRLVSTAAYEIKAMLADIVSPGDVGIIDVARKDGQDITEAIDVTRTIISRMVGASGHNWPKMSENSNRRAYQTIVKRFDDENRAEVWIRRLSPVDADRSMRP